MQVEYHKWYSRYLNRDMEYKTFGDRGHALIAFPCQDGRFFDYADQGMIHVLTPWIEAGKIRVICVDGIDWETWSNFGGDPRWRIEQHERWFNYIIEELLPNIRYYDGETFMTTGCSMGAMHAANFFFRRPDIFDTVIGLSGLYYAGYGFPYYSDELTYANSPQDFLQNMPEDHFWMQLYRQRRIIFCIGQGRWEEDTLASTRELDRILCEKHIPAWFDYWGYDCDHDWPWWRRQLPHFMSHLEPL
ncbi:MAG: esterase family protein [Bacteroidales bacterium]|jgi:esterase/lipase superfamily enzyme|nr:esterase family protein [Bacteroidales bacterium]